MLLSRVFGGFRGSERCRHASARGFTMIELMVTLTILAVLTVVAAPSFNNALLSNRLAGVANSFTASTQLARSEAIKRNSTVRLCRSSTGTSCATTGTWAQGWIVFHDIDNDGTVGAGEPILQVQQAIQADYHFTTTSTGTPYSLKFAAIGGTADSATLLLCRATPSPGQQERVISISATGRISVTTTRTGTCV
jgi:type IV fimbrial biogenesis protein FimT